MRFARRGLPIIDRTYGADMDQKTANDRPTLDHFIFALQRLRPRFPAFECCGVQDPWTGEFKMRHQPGCPGQRLRLPRLVTAEEREKYGYGK